MMRKIKLAVASGKGGVGKSMVASSLALWLSQRFSLVAVDADVDAPNLHLWLGQGEDWDETEEMVGSEKAVVVKEKFAGASLCPRRCPFGALQWERGRLRVNRYFCEGCGACVELCLPGAIEMVSQKNALLRVRNDAGGFPLVSGQLYPGESGSGRVVDRLMERAEKFNLPLMVIDAPAGTGCPVIAALRRAQGAILVTEPTPSGRSDLRRVLAVVSYFHLPFWLIVNKWDLFPDFTKKIMREYEGKILGKISYDQRIFDSLSRLEPVLKTSLPVKRELEKIFLRLEKKMF